MLECLNIGSVAPGPILEPLVAFELPLSSARCVGSCSFVADGAVALRLLAAGAQRPRSAHLLLPFVYS